MIRYDYICECGWVFEVVKSIKDDTEEQCPKCQKFDTRRTISPTDLILRGKGFHDTDYGKHGPK